MSDSWKAMGQKAKNKRRAGPSGKVRPHKSKKKRPYSLECRYVGDDSNICTIFGGSYFSREWHKYYRNYPSLKAAESGVKALSRNEHWDFEYRVKHENTKTTKGTTKKKSPS